MIRHSRSAACMRLADVHARAGSWHQEACLAPVDEGLAR
jgi:hypothetical protein